MISRRAPVRARPRLTPLLAGAVDAERTRCRAETACRRVALAARVRGRTAGTSPVVRAAERRRLIGDAPPVDAHFDVRIRARRADIGGGAGRDAVTLDAHCAALAIGVDRTDGRVEAADTTIQVAAEPDGTWVVRCALRRADAVDTRLAGQALRTVRAKSALWSALTIDASRPTAATLTVGVAGRHWLGRGVASVDGARLRGAERSSLSAVAPRSGRVERDRVVAHALPLAAPGPVRTVRVAVASGDAGARIRPGHDHPTAHARISGAHEPVPAAISVGRALPEDAGARELGVRAVVTAGRSADPVIAGVRIDRAAREDGAGPK